MSKGRISFARIAWAAAAMAMLVALPARAGMNELMRETQRTMQKGDQLSMVMWMPIQFWEESLKANPAIPAEARDQMLAMLSDYTVLGVMRAKTGMGGISDAQSKAEMLKNLKLESGGKLIEPLGPEAVNPGAQLLLGQIKPAIAAMAGPVGKNIEFVVFPAKADGKLQIDAGSEGRLRVTFYDEVIDWRLPLGSLLPVRKDAKTGEEFPGNYSFNPFTGERL